MSTLSRSRSRSRFIRGGAKRRAFVQVEHQLTIPDALLAWGKDPSRAMHWARPWAEEVEQLLAEAPLAPERTEVLLSRLGALVGEAVRAGQQALLLGLDLQTAEWLGLHITAETARGTMHIGPDPHTQQFGGASEPEWTYAEVRAVAAANNPIAPDLAWKAKQLLADAFPDARIRDVFQEHPDLRCVACTRPLGSVTFRSEAGGYCWKCWSELASLMPEHVRKIAARAPRVKKK